LPPRLPAKESIFRSAISSLITTFPFNYDIPWNPNRLNTIEGQVLRKLLEKLQEIRNALDDDSVFNVVGEILPAAHVERVLRDY
jgi:hypothetical protein